MAGLNATIPNNNKSLLGRHGASGANTAVGNATLTPAQQRVEMFIARKGGTIETVRTGTAEILPQLASHFQLDPKDMLFIDRIFAEMNDRNLSVSQFLEDADPSDQYTGAMARMDAFQRQLMIHGIRTSSVPENGIFSDKIQRFFENDRGGAPVLFAEFINRVMRGKDSVISQERLTESNIPGSPVLYPESINRVLRESPIIPDVLDLIIATTNSAVTGDFYRTINTNDTAAQRRMPRVGQGADLPKVTLSTTEKAINLYKYGRMLEATYEFFRAVTIDLFAIYLRRIAMQARLDKADAAIDVAINGDGNSNAATNYNQSTLDTGVTPTYKAFLAFALNFWKQGFRLNRLVGGDTAFINFLTMSRPSVDPYQLLTLLQNNQVINQKVQLGQDLYSDVQLVYLGSVASNVLVGLDQRFALEQVVDNNASIVETDKLIASQRQQIAVSEKVGFAQIFNGAIATWTTNA
jgi:hypothetical protein